MVDIVRLIEPTDVHLIAGIEAAADELLVARFGSELFSEVSAGEARVAEPGFLLVAGQPCVGFAHVLEQDGGAHLQQLAVDPTHGRRGLGTALVEACCARAQQRGHDALTLTTFRDLPFNAPWYARLGFVVIEHPDGAVAEHVRQERPYGELAPRVAMRRTLEPRADTGDDQAWQST